MQRAALDTPGLGRFNFAGWRRLATDSRRLEAGAVFVFPGIDGESFFTRSILRGLCDAGLPYAMETDDWTWRWPLLLYNLRSRRLHETQSQRIADRVRAYQREYPGRPVYLVGHSGGGAMALRVLEKLAPDERISGAVLLGAAVSARFPLGAALQHVERGVWNFSSKGDFLFLNLFTRLCGTTDGWHEPSIGWGGCNPHGLNEAEAARLFEFPYRREYWRCRNWAGHFGYTARPFVREWVAPLLTAAPSPLPSTGSPL